MRSTTYSPRRLPHVCAVWAPRVHAAHSPGLSGLVRCAFRSSPRLPHVCARCAPLHAAHVTTSATSSPPASDGAASDGVVSDGGPSDAVSGVGAMSSPKRCFRPIMERKSAPSGERAFQSATRCPFRSALLKVIFHECSSIDVSTLRCLPASIASTSSRKTVRDNVDTSSRSTTLFISSGAASESQFTCSAKGIERLVVTS